MTAERLHQRTWARVALALLVVGALSLAGYAAVVTDLIDVSWGAGRSAATPSATPSRTPTPTPKPSPSRTPAGRVLDALQSGALPTRAGIAAELADPLRTAGVGPHVGVAIRDALTGKLLYGKGNDAGFVPASTTKIVTATAVLAALGPQHRFETRVVAGAKPGELVLVGGGDPLLATKGAKGYPERATIEDLAAATAKELKQRKLTSARVLVDASLFQQPISPEWEPQYVPGSVVSRITALWVNEGRAKVDGKARSKDPALAAAEAFAKALGTYGIKVSTAADRGKAPAGADELASVKSAPLDEIVEHVLTTSDNEGAEVLARHVAVSQDLPATFGGAMKGFQLVLGELGVDASDLRLYDGSGLSRKNKLTPNAISSVLALAANPDHPELRAVLTGLPVAGFSGTLDERFGGEASDPGEGVVRAKTGTLTGIASLAGVVTTKDGALLTFALMADRTTAGDPRLGLDRAAAALATCGCR